MARRLKIACLAALFSVVLLAACEKSLHEKDERYVFVAPQGASRDVVLEEPTTSTARAGYQTSRTPISFIRRARLIIFLNSV